MESELHQITKLQQTMVFAVFRLLHDCKRGIERIKVEEQNVLRYIHT